VTLIWYPTTYNPVYYEVSASANAMNGSTAITVPDLSSLPGFLALPASKQSVQWWATVTTQTFGVNQLIPANGTATSVANSGSYTVP
jgi:hypothetical protein